MRESQSKKVEKYRNASTEKMRGNLSKFFFGQLFYITNFKNLARDAATVDGIKTSGNFFGGKSTIIKL